MKTKLPSYLLGLAVSLAGATQLAAQGTAFTYQGRLNDGVGPASGNYDLRFTIYDSSGGPGVVAGPVTNSPVAISNGLFTVKLDFGSGVFDGGDRWLDIGVRTNGDGAFSPLTPRQMISPTPYAIMSGNLSGPLPAAQLTGSMSVATLPTGGNWALNSTLTLDATTLAVDPINKRVGIGTSSPSTALTVDTGIGYGIEHTDGIRRLSTFLDEGGCWLGSVSADKLNFFVNNGGSSLTVDLAGRVGIGTTSPSWPLQVVAGQSVVRLDSTANVFGSVLELRNNTASPSYLGAINFQNAAGTYPGQIGYTGDNALTFRTAGAERMRLNDGGRLDVTGTNSSVSLNAVFTFQGIPLPQAIRATSDAVFGTAVSASSADGTAISGGSANGWAGNFSGAVRIVGNSSHGKPFLQIHETEDGDYARIQLQVASRPLWHIAVGGGDNSLAFYNSTNSVVAAISESGTLTTKVLTITGGADIAEPFAMSQRDLPKGAVVIIDEEHPGHLKLSAEPYDRRVAGIISGAGGVNPGLSLSQQGVVEGDQHVALTGRVYVQADASGGPIRPGDLLTTSALPGHAMKVADHARAQGAILGKAMTVLKDGTGLVLVLVTLQ